VARAITFVSLPGTGNTGKNWQNFYSKWTRKSRRNGFDRNTERPRKTQLRYCASHTAVLYNTITMRRASSSDRKRTPHFFSYRYVPIIMDGVITYTNIRTRNLDINMIHNNTRARTIAAVNASRLSRDTVSYCNICRVLTILYAFYDVFVVHDRYFVSSCTYLVLSTSGKSPNLTGCDIRPTERICRGQFVYNDRSFIRYGNNPK